MKSIQTDLADYCEIYDAIQTGEIDAEMGDVINGKFLMINGYHLEPLSEGPFSYSPKPCLIIPLKKVLRNSISLLAVARLMTG